MFSKSPIFTKQKVAGGGAKSKARESVIAQVSRQINSGGPMGSSSLQGNTVKLSHDSLAIGNRGIVKKQTGMRATGYALSGENNSSRNKWNGGSFKTDGSPGSKNKMFVSK